MTCKVQEQQPTVTQEFSRTLLLRAETTAPDTWSRSRATLSVLRPEPHPIKQTTRYSPKARMGSWEPSCMPGDTASLFHCWGSDVLRWPPAMAELP
jgi:hypothetical protein